MLSWLRLIRSHRVGPGTFLRLMAEHGSAAAALAALPSLARGAGVTGYVPCLPAQAEDELAAARACGAQPLCLGDPAYPPALAALGDAPPLIWLHGRRDLLTRPAVAVVGARNASSLGVRMARALAAGLAEAGFTVVSGLARGIDAAAHAAALPGGTIAVMAGGVDRVYPPENAPLAERIAGDGLLLSEQPMGLSPQARHFPRRNRLVSGLALGVVVVEAAPRSGSLITARMALEQGREVMAVPAHPFDARGGGCNALIREGAVLVRDAADVIAALGEAGAATPAPAPAVARGGRPPSAQPRAADGALSPPSAPPAAAPAQRTAGPRPATAAPATAPAEAAPPPVALAERILGRLGVSPLAEDQLIRDLALPAAQLAPALLELELEGRIARQPGGLLARVD